MACSASPLSGAVNIYQNHRPNPMDCTFLRPETLFNVPSASGGRRPGLPIRPERLNTLLDWLQTLTPNTQESLLQALKRCVEVSGLCPVAFVKGKAVEALDQSLNMLLSAQGPDDADRNGSDTKKTEPSLDLCFEPDCPTCRLLTQDQASRSLLPVSFWSASLGGRPVSLGHVPAAFEVAEIKALVASRVAVGEAAAEDVVLLHKDYNLKDLQVLSDLAASGRCLLFQLWERDGRKEKATRLGEEWKGLRQRQKELAEECTLSVQAMKKERKEMGDRGRDAIAALESERDKELELIQMRYNQLILQQKEENQLAKEVMDREIKKRTDKAREVERLGAGKDKDDKGDLSSVEGDLSPDESDTPRTRVFFDIRHGGVLFRIVAELFNDIEPEVAEFVKSLCTGEWGFGSKGGYIQSNGGHGEWTLWSRADRNALLSKYPTRTKREVQLEEAALRFPRSRKGRKGLPSKYPTPARRDVQFEPHSGRGCLMLYPNDPGVVYITASPPKEGQLQFGRIVEGLETMERMCDRRSVSYIVDCGEVGRP